MSGVMRCVGYPAEALAPVFADRDAGRLKACPEYQAAKHGDPESALDLVLRLLPRAAFAEARRQFAPGSWFVPAVSRERKGHNAIPIAYARVLAEVCGGDVWTDIVQSNIALHTGANAMERLAARPLFDGPAPTDRPCILVDDVSTMGSTLAELADHILLRNGAVVGSALLVNASRSGSLHPNRTTIERLEARLGHEITQEFDINPGALTYDEAQYLAGFRDAHELRHRAAAARNERNRRLGQAVIPGEKGPQPVTDAALAPMQSAPPHSPLPPAVIFW